MELLQLKYFCDAARSQNFSKTASRFCVPPSNISQSIRRLEQELQVSLFVRQANSVRLNDMGTEFYNRISAALKLIEEAKSSVSDDVNRGRIRICINANRRIVMQTIEKFKLKYPDVEIHTTHFGSADDGNFDVVITGDASGLAGFKRERLISEGVALALRADNPLASVSDFSLAELSGASFITMTEKSSLLGLTKKICNDFGFEPRITIQSDDPFYVRKCVELGLGVAIVPSFSWEGQFSDEVALRVIEGYKRDTYMCLNENKYLSRSVKEFCAMLVAECT